jgi:hypothetical protein
MSINIIIQSRTRYYSSRILEHVAIWTIHHFLKRATAQCGHNAFRQDLMTHQHGTRKNFQVTWTDPGWEQSDYVTTMLMWGLRFRSPSSCRTLAAACCCEASRTKWGTNECSMLQHFSRHKLENNKHKSHSSSLGLSHSNRIGRNKIDKVHKRMTKKEIGPRHSSSC